MPDMHRCSASCFVCLNVVCTAVWYSVLHLILTQILLYYHYLPLTGSMC